ncbi:hypothetical protein [Anaerophilus nitritogenes]|uniref:hypothetical protein n=1 Tax=Anaerophilus nitritogenes TaxID=2498136 RepID=UPI00101C95D0|nr:hypothetical protein [Anaerophilus nitritogenes]
MYVSYDEVKKRNIKILESLPKEHIEDRLSSISKMVDEYCNTKFKPTIDTYKTDLREKIIVRKRPLLQVDSLRINDEIIIEDQDFYVEKDSNLIEIDEPINYKRRRKNVKIEYQYGYDEVPETVKDVIIELLILEESEKDMTGNMKSQSWEDYSYTREDSDKLKTKEDILSRLLIYQEDREISIMYKENNKIHACLL